MKTVSDIEEAKLLEEHQKIVKDIFEILKSEKNDELAKKVREADKIWKKYIEIALGTMK